jgi:hypothetical protein
LIEAQGAVPCRRVGRGAAFGAFRGAVRVSFGFTRRTALSASSKGSGIDSLPLRWEGSCGCWLAMLLEYR